jgi:hypothetical protein
MLVQPQPLPPLRLHKHPLAGKWRKNVLNCHSRRRFGFDRGGKSRSIPAVRTANPVFHHQQFH